MLRRFKQLLNPAQVFDLMNGGPHIGYVIRCSTDLMNGGPHIGYVIALAPPGLSRMVLFLPLLDISHLCTEISWQYGVW